MKVDVVHPQGLDPVLRRSRHAPPLTVTLRQAGEQTKRGQGTGGVYDASEHHRKVRLIANRLLSKKWESGRDFWQMQLDLLALQRDIQSAITAEKKKAPRDRSRATLQRLQDARWHARHVGDSLAWLLLGTDKQFIASLSENSRVPVTNDDHGSTGMIVMAQGLNGRGWGFPLLHDVTHLLRIGDITFIRPREDPEHVTVEIKTELIEELSPDQDGKQRHKYRARVHTMVGLDPETGLPLSGPQPQPPPPPREPKTRFERQAVRMRDAVVKGTAAPGLITGLAEPILNMHVESESESHWKTVRRLVREAHRTGYAKELVDGAFYYLVAYREGGVTTEHLADPRFMAGVTESGFLECVEPAEQVLMVHSIPKADEQTPVVALPYFLFPISRRAVFELLNHELVLTVVVNQGRVCDLLRERGFEVEVRPERNGPGEIVIIDEFESSDGIPLRGEVHTMWHTLRESISECRSMDYIADMLDGMVAGMRDHAMAYPPGEAHPG